MTCCNQSCSQGRTCPVRASRNAGVCHTEPDDIETHTHADVVASVVLVIAAYSVVCGWLGYLWAIHGAAIEAFLWALASKLF